MARWTRQEISDVTGFDRGDVFESEEQLREYFTVANMRDMFGPDDELPTQEELDEMCETVLEHRWHLSPSWDDLLADMIREIATYHGHLLSQGALTEQQQRLRAAYMDDLPDPLCRIAEAWVSAGPTSEVGTVMGDRRREVVVYEETPDGEMHVLRRIPGLPEELVDAVYEQCD